MRPCMIDGCALPAVHVVVGHPDDVELCDEHLWTACECVDESLSDMLCPLHGNDEARRTRRRDLACSDCSDLDYAQPVGMDLGGHLEYHECDTCGRRS